MVIKQYFPSSKLKNTLFEQVFLASYPATTCQARRYQQINDPQPTDLTTITTKLGNSYYW